MDAKRSLTGSIILSTLFLLSYTLVFYYTGDSQWGAFGVVPIMWVAYFYGPAWGITGGTLLGVLVVILSFVSNSDEFVQKHTMLFISGSFGYALVGGIVGMMGNYSNKLQREVQARIKVEDELRKSKMLLEKSVKSKELLLHELNHRVKNNLNLVRGIMSLELLNASDEAAAVIKEIDGRINAIVSIHEAMQHSGNINRVETDEYFGAIIDTLLFLSAPYKEGRLKVFSHIDSFYMDVHRATSLGLVLNELLTNALKYGVPEKASAQIRVEMKKDTDNGIQVIVENTGNPFPSGLSVENASSLGLRMVHSLVAELGGSLETEFSDATRFTCTLPELD